MKNVSRIVALVLSASAGVWLTGCAAEVGDLSEEETDLAPANIQKGGLTKSHLGGQAPISKGKGLTDQGGQFGSGSLGKGSQFESGSQSGSLGKGGGGRFSSGGSQAEQPALVNSQEGGQLANEGQIEDSQRAGAGLEGQVADQGLALEDDTAGQEEGASSESQEALTSWGYYGGYYGRPWYGGWRGGWRGYGYYPGRRFFYGAPYYGCGGGYIGGYDCGLPGGYW